MAALRPSDRLVLVFTVLYLGVAAPVALSRHDAEFLLYIAALVVILVGVLSFHLRVGLHPASLWGMSLWGLAHLCGGLWRIGEPVGVLYGLWLIPERLRFDQVVHAYGFGMASWLCWQGLRVLLRDPRPRFGPLLLCAAAGMGFGALNEVLEFAATETLPETNVGGYVNTGWDLVANLVGAVLAVILIRFLAGRGGSPDGSGIR